MMMFFQAQTRFGVSALHSAVRTRPIRSATSGRALSTAFLSFDKSRRFNTFEASVDSQSTLLPVAAAFPSHFPSHLSAGQTVRRSTRLFSTTSEETAEEEDSFFADDTVTFGSLGIQSPILLERLTQLGFERPTKVQAESFAKILAKPETKKEEEESDDDEPRDIYNAPRQHAPNVIIGSETGSGKTLAYLLPLLDDILRQKKRAADENIPLTYDYARAIILVPNKELVQQVLRMALPLCGGKASIIWGGGNQLADLLDGYDDDSAAVSTDPTTTIRLAVMPGGLMEPMDFKPFRDTKAMGGDQPPVDLIFSTPAAIGPLALKAKHIDMFADIPTLIVDEADMLLDGGYIRPLENVLTGFRRADRLDPSLGVQKTQHVFCAATLPDMGLKSVDAYLHYKFPYAARISMSGMHNARHYGLKQATQWIGPIETKKERMEQLIELLKTPVEDEKGGLEGEKVMVFLNSVEDVEGAQGAFERAGVKAVPYHAKIGLGDRSKNLDQFRRYSKDTDGDDGKKGDTVSVLVCTDLASRGLDVPGVDAVVQLQFSGNVVSHLHRMGRCGRAGQRTGRGIVFFNDAEAELVQVVQDAETQQERMVLQGDVEDLDEDDEGDTGNVKKAFSRKRGFTKKRKKLRREAQP